MNWPMHGYSPYLHIFIFYLLNAALCFHMKASQIRISEASKAEYEKYLYDTCQEKKRHEYTVEDYLEWEQNEFLRSLRIALLPETIDGDFRTAMSTGITNIVPSLFIIPSHPSGKCRRHNTTMDFEERVHVYTTFEDLLIDLVLTSKIAEGALGPSWRLRRSSLMRRHGISSFAVLCLTHSIFFLQIISSFAFFNWRFFDSNG